MRAILAVAVLTAAQAAGAQRVAERFRPVPSVSVPPSGGAVPAWAATSRAAWAGSADAPAAAARVPRAGQGDAPSAGSAAHRGLAFLPMWAAPIASAAIPGLGQGVLHQQRAAAYLAAEAFVWLQYLKDRRDLRDQTNGYVDLAARVARASFSSNPPRGDWAYYEWMEHYAESGVYSQNGDTVHVQPNTNEATYNGAVWLLARRTYWADPASPPPETSDAYRKALVFYQERAYRPDYRWSWANAQLERDLFRRMINKRNDANRHMTSDVGVLIANHVLSTVDAFASLRLRLSTGPQGDYELHWSVPFGAP
ncbi:MAG TPA: hypothetical protein VG818_02895 [Gemmatimonadaceae bacterium]|jgi:hypothetical protein|nr:hypothetical protein [Gemmatimonadaceae bacterium]